MTRRRLIASLLSVAFGIVLIFVASVLLRSPRAFYNHCGTAAVVKPAYVTQFCADGGEFVSDIEWSSWGSRSAQGSGYFSVDDCTPTCISGTEFLTPVTILLNGPTKTHGKNYLMQVTVLPEPGKHFRWPPTYKSKPAVVRWTTDYWQG
jgi:hypothetical protein